MRFCKDPVGSIPIGFEDMDQSDRERCRLRRSDWGLLVSITNDLPLPAMARVRAEIPVSLLGKGDFNVRALFTSDLELCFAGIMAVLLNSCSQKARRIQPKAVRRTSVEAPPISFVAPPAV